MQKQSEMDDEVVKLVQTMLKVYSFVEDVNFVPEKIKILEDTLTKIAKQTVECANFLHEYTNEAFSGNGSLSLLSLIHSLIRASRSDNIPEPKPEED